MSSQKSSQRSKWSRKKNPGGSSDRNIKNYFGSLTFDQMHSFLSPPKPFSIDFAQSEIDELNKRLNSARWPKEDIIPYVEAEEGAFDSYGPSQEWMTKTAIEWEKYSWKETEARLNESVSI